MNWVDKFENGMYALGLDPSKQNDVEKYLRDSPAARKKWILMQAENETVGNYGLTTSTIDDIIDQS